MDLKSISNIFTLREQRSWGGLEVKWRPWDPGYRVKCCRELIVVTALNWPGSLLLPGRSNLAPRPATLPIFFRYENALASKMKWVRGLKVVSGRSDGYTLVLAAFTISLLIISTQVYIYRLSRTRIDDNYGTLTDYILSIRQGSRHVAIASLISVSKGGSVSNFIYNLNRWESFVASDYKFGRCTLNSTLASESPYSGGIWLSWGTEGMGVSSASAVLEMELGGRGVEANWIFTENITTTLLFTGRLETMRANFKRVTVLVHLLNEGAPALAGSIKIMYQRGGWRDSSGLDDYVQMDYGNGTYLVSFSDKLPSISEIIVRVQAYDSQGVFVQADDTFILDI